MLHKRQPVANKFHYDIVSDGTVEEPVEAFEVKIFFASLDIVRNKLVITFSGLQTIVEYYLFLTSNKLTVWKNKPGAL